MAGKPESGTVNPEAFESKQEQQPKPAAADAKQEKGMWARLKSALFKSAETDTAQAAAARGKALEALGETQTPDQQAAAQQEYMARVKAMDAQVARDQERGPISSRERQAERDREAWGQWMDYALANGLMSEQGGATRQQQEALVAAGLTRDHIVGLLAAQRRVHARGMSRQAERRSVVRNETGYESAENVNEEILAHETRIAQLQQTLDKLTQQGEGQSNAANIRREQIDSAQHRIAELKKKLAKGAA